MGGDLNAKTVSLTQQSENFITYAIGLLNRHARSYAHDADLRSLLGKRVEKRTYLVWSKKWVAASD